MENIMFITIALFTLLSTQASAFNFPNLDFNMAENAIESSKAVKEQATALNSSVADVERISRKVYLVTLDNDCSFVATFGAWSKVSVSKKTISCN
jgi:hypothetical protein